MKNLKSRLIGRRVEVRLYDNRWVRGTVTSVEVDYDGIGPVLVISFDDPDLGSSRWNAPGRHGRCRFLGVLDLIAEAAK